MPLLSLFIAIFFSASAWASLPQAGVYTLVTGTDGCAESVEWTSQCNGFVLTPSHDGRALNAEKFCNINQGKTSELVTANQKIINQVSHKEDHIRRLQTQVFFAKNESLELVSEDSIMVDTKGAFLWDSNKNNRGMSCLYKN